MKASLVVVGGGDDDDGEELSVSAQQSAKSVWMDAPFALVTKTSSQGMREVRGIPSGARSVGVYQEGKMRPGLILRRHVWLEHPGHAKSSGLRRAKWHCRARPRQCTDNHDQRKRKRRVRIPICFCERPSRRRVWAKEEGKTLRYDTKRGRARS